MHRTTKRRTGWWLISVVLLALLLTACSGVPAVPRPNTAAPPAGEPVGFPLKAPPGFRISIYARKLGEARVIAWDAQGIPYVTIMNRDQKKGGKVVALPDRDRNGVADAVVPVLEGLDRPHGLVFYNGSMYVSEPSRIRRIVSQRDDLRVDRTEVVVDGISTIGDHWTRPFLFERDGTIIVAVGSTCNVCQEGDKTRATIIRYKPGEPAKQGVIVARGLRSIVGMAYRPATNEVWLVDNGRDDLGPDQPPDTVIRLAENKHYGWPYCYGDRVVDQEVLNNPNISTPDKSPKDEFCRTKVTAPDMLLPPHVAPLSVVFSESTQFPASMRGGMFMAWHGAWDGQTNTGYRVVYVPFKDGKPGAPQDFVTGFLKAKKDWYARPTFAAFGPDGSLYILDDTVGNVYRVDYVGQ